MLRYYIWLSRLGRIPLEKRKRLLEIMGDAQKLHAASESELAKALPLKDAERRAFADKSLHEAESIIADCRKVKADIITIDDKRYPDRLRNIFDPPLVLYVRGTLPNIDDSPAFAIVGQRKATAGGIIGTKKIAYELSRHGMIIVSGMAEGIDSAAHNGALDGGSPTVTVWGTSIDKCYPSFNVPLMRAIERSGAIISEYPPFRRTYAADFVHRNRIISGLSLGVLVAEAKKKSGSLTTAKYAQDQGRDIFALPGNAEDESYRGANYLIQDGAKLVLSAEDILVEYRGRYAFVEKGGVKKQPEVIDNGGKSHYTLSQMLEKKAPAPANELHRAILQSISGLTHVDEIALKAGLPVEKVLVELIVMEVTGLVKRHPGDLFAIK